MKSVEKEAEEERSRNYCLADSDLVICKGDCEIINSLVLTRAFIYDTELQKKSETDKLAKNAEEGDRLAKKLEEIDLNQGCFGEGIPVEQPSPTGQIELGPWGDLPTEFGRKPRPEDIITPRKSRMVKKRNYEDETSGAIQWLHAAEFDEYWKYTSEFILYYTWLKLAGDTLSIDAYEQLEQSIRKSKPKPNFAPLIEQHSEENLEKVYASLVKNHPDYETAKTDPEILYALHCTLVKEKAEQDFADFKNNSTVIRCKDFFSKIEKMGFSPGITDKDIKEPVSGDDPSQVVTSPSTSSECETPRKKGRFPVVYGDDEVFSDIYFNIFDKISQSGKTLLGTRTQPAKHRPAESKESATEDQLSEDYKEVSFDFDPETESHLLASNAHIYYKDDAELRKYYYQRYRLFSKLDEGVIMDREGWFSVTPEKIAAHIAERIVNREGMIVVDAFAGVGGNSIQFALKGARVIAIDLDPTRLKCAFQNAKVYGVADRIEFICCDFFHFAEKWRKEKDTQGQIDAIFLSPPWGGPSYMDKKEFLLDEGITPDGFDIFTASRKITPNIAYFLPKNTSIKQLQSLVDPGGRMEIEQSCLNKKIKLITAYYGNLARRRPE